MVDYAYTTDVESDFDSTIERVTELLEEEGFGIITEIDVTATLKKKLDLDYRDYRILGACSPGHAHRALEAEDEIGVLLPCNVVVYENDGGITVAAMNPSSVMKMADNPDLTEVAGEVDASIRAVLDRL